MTLYVVVEISKKIRFLQKKSQSSTAWTICCMSIYEKNKNRVVVYILVNILVVYENKIKVSYCCTRNMAANIYILQNRSYNVIS